MKKITFLSVLLLQVAFMHAQTMTYNFTGSVQTYTVPACVDSITIDLQGAQGGDGPIGCSGGQGFGGLGGRVQATIPVTAGDVLSIYVGGAGAIDNNSSAAGGFNGGGNAMMEANYTYYGGGGGGGASDIRINGIALTDRVAVAGGGGGAGTDGCNCNGLNGGDGGGLIAGAGTPGPICSCNPSGLGGTQSAGGVQGNWACTCNATPGSLGQGGDSNSGDCGGPTGGGAGGGGYYGGGGGGLGAGGGGSNYTFANAVNVTNSMAVRSGDGIVMLTPISSAPNPGSVTGSGAICENTSGNYSIAAMPNATSYTWSVPAGSVINSGQGTTAINVTAGNTSGNIYVTATYPCGTSDSTTFAFTVNPTPVIGGTAVPSNSICEGSSVTLNGSGAAMYSWSGGITDGVAFIPASTATYVVTGTDGNGCMDSASVTVTINPLPSVTLGSDMIQCGGTITLNAGNAGATYLWNDNSTNQLLTVSSSGIYSVLVTTAAGCSGSDTIDVTINTPPTVTVTFAIDTVCVNGGTFVLSGGESPTGGTWSGTGVTGNTLDPMIAGVGTDSITYSYTDINNCTSSITKALWIDLCSTINSQSFANTNIEMYPNPNNGTFTLTIGNITGEGVLEITDALGRVIYSENVVATNHSFVKSLNLGNNTNGIYFVHFKSAASTTVQKVIIQE